MGLMLAECFGRDLSKVQENKDIYFTCGVTELIQNSPLKFDDTEDSSHTRSGDLNTYKKFDIDVAVNARNSLYFAPIPKLDRFIHDEKLRYKMHKIYVEELTNIHFGQAWDIYWQNSKGKVPNQAQYLQMVKNKTSVLPRMCLRMIAEQTE